MSSYLQRRNETFSLQKAVSRNGTNIAEVIIQVDWSRLRFHPVSTRWFSMEPGLHVGDLGQKPKLFSLQPPLFLQRGFSLFSLGPPLDWPHALCILRRKSSLGLAQICPAISSSHQTLFRLFGTFSAEIIFGKNSGSSVWWFGEKQILSRFLFVLWGISGVTLTPVFLRMNTCEAVFLRRPFSISAVKYSRLIQLLSELIVASRMVITEKSVFLLHEARQVLDTLVSELFGTFPPTAGTEKLLLKVCVFLLSTKGRNYSRCFVALNCSIVAKDRCTVVHNKQIITGMPSFFNSEIDVNRFVRPISLFAHGPFSLWKKNNLNFIGFSLFPAFQIWQPLGVQLESSGQWNVFQRCTFLAETKPGIMQSLPCC